MTSDLGLSHSIRDQACQLFQTAQNDDLLLGSSIGGAVSAALYPICRLNEQPQSVGDIAVVAKVAVEDIRYCY